MERGLLLILVSVMINAFMPVVFKYLYHFIDPLTLLAVLAWIAFSFSVIILRPGKEAIRKAKELSRLLSLAGLGVGLNMLLYFGGLSLTTISSAVLMVQSTYIFTILFAFKFLGERVNRWEKAGMVIASAGLFLVAWNGMNINEVLRSENFVGNTMVFFSGICLSMYVTAQKKILKKAKPREVIPVFLAMGSLVGIGVISIIGWRVNTAIFEPLPIMSILFIAFFNSFFTVLLWMEGLKTVKVITANLLGNIYPVMGVIFGVLFFSETVSAYQAMGALGIIAGTIIASKSD